MHPSRVDKTISDEATEWFSRLHSGQVAPDEFSRFERWRGQSPEHAQAYEDVQSFWALLDEPARRIFEAEETEARRAAAFRPTLSAYSAKAGLTGRPARSAWAGLALAAAVAGWLWLPGLVRFWASDYHTDWGERREFVLADQSHILLNTHSALSVEFSPEQRLVKLLEGEAYFQVTKNLDRPFIVATPQGTVQVTGTAFNVYDQPEQTTVTVTEGRVRVYAPGTANKPVELTPGLQVTSDAHGVGPVLRVDAKQAAAWRDGLLVFDSQPLAAVAQELNRYFPGKLVIADPRLRERIVSGAFDLSHPQDILTALEKTLGLRSISVPGALTVLYQSSL